MGVSNRFIFVATVTMLLLLQLDSLAAVEPEESEVASQEYCLSETFHPKCMKNEVIFLRNATYGRMHLGRCITDEEMENIRSGDVGCSTDVLPLLDRKCSGQSECEIRVFDISSEGIKPCRASLYVFLEVSYECLPIVDDRRSCTVEVTTNPVHLISSSTLCGTDSQPWIIEAPHGQQLRIDLFDFNATAYGRQSCHRRGVVVDKSGKTNTSICVGGTQRVKNLFLSTENTVQIFFSQSQQVKSGENEQQFILRFQAVGCSDIIPPADAYLRRNGDSIVIGCYASRKNWRLTCKDGKWVGVIGNCSHGVIAVDSTIESEPGSVTDNKERVLAIVAVCGFTFAVCLIIVCLGILCLHRFQGKIKANNQEYKTLNYRTQPIRNQSTDQTIQGGHSTGLAGNRNDMQGLVPSQIPTYSVYVGQDYSNDFEECEGNRIAEGRFGAAVNSK